MKVFSQFDPSVTLHKLCFDGESQYFDRKSARLAPKDLGKQLSAFANASGGLIVIGIEDDGRVSGLECVNDAENRFRQTPADYLEFSPEYIIETIPYLDEEQGYRTIMLFHIQPSFNRIIKTKTGDTYLRIGDQSRKLGADDLLRLEYSRGIRSYEEQIAEDATMEDLDAQLVTEYAKRFHAEASSEQDLLKARGAIKIKNGNVQITNAGILLFGKIPTQFIPCARVRFLRYDGISEGVGRSLNIIKDETVEKPLPTLLIKMKQLLASQMREFQTMSNDGIFRKYPEYPEFAWLEGLVNAVTHRDYSIQGDYIRVKMFDDRIEFTSPGKLPNVVTVENIQNTRYSRNPIVARILTDIGWVRELNEGVKRIYIDMESFFLDPPIFSEPGEQVKLVLKNNIAMRSMRRIEELMRIITKEQWEELDDLEKKIIVLVANLEKCTIKMLAERTGKSRVTIQKRIKNLVPRIIIEHKSSSTDPMKYFTLQ